MVRSVFHGVGQGLFYSGRVGQFDFVFDCGIKGAQYVPSLKQEIVGFRSELKSKPIDLLIVSHLHEDHVSGLPELLKSRKAKIIVLPYLLPWKRLTLAMTSRNIGFWYYEFLTNPARFLLEHEYTDKVVYIDGNSGPGPDIGAEGPPSYDQIPPFTGEDNQPKVDFTDLSDSVARQSILELEHAGDYQERILTKSHRGLARATLAGFPFWIFRFYHRDFKQRNSQLRTCLRKQTGFESLKGFSTNQLKQILESNSKTRALRHCYEQVSGRNLNWTCLTCFHGPTFGGHFHRHVVHPSGNPVQLWDSCRTRLGFFLTGDAVLKGSNNWKEFEKQYHSYFPYMTTVSVPHHGARTSWNLALLDKAESGALWVVSAGSKNQFGHPHIEVVHDILRKHGLMLWSHEKSDVVEESHIH